jgi:hypothetical protein
MNNVKHFPAGLDHQGRNRTRDRSAEREWLDTVQVPRRVPLQRTEKRLSRSARAWIIVGCCALAWLALLGLGAAVVGTGVLLAAMVAA